MPKKNNTAVSWERQPGEGEKPFEAFSLYRDKGKSRTLYEVANELQKSYTLIRRWKDKYNWVERVRDYDNDLERKAKAKAEKGLRDMYDRQTKLAMSIQAKALKALDALDPEDLSPKDIKEYIKMATDLERLNRTLNSADTARGEENTQTSLADIIVSAYQRRKENE